MNKYLKILFLLILSVLSVLLLSGCSHHHYSRRDAIKWFQETYVDEKLVVSRDYTERKNSSGYTDKVWKAHLKELPEVEFELISHKYYSLFTQYDLKTSYELEMASYYLEQYQKLQDVETESLYNEKLAINGIYHTVQEMENLCKELGDFDDYVREQKYPCSIRYGVAYAEPLTFVSKEEDPSVMDHETYVYEDGDSRRDPEEDGELEEVLGKMAEKYFAAYTITYRIEMEQFTEEELERAADWRANYRFTVIRPDEMEICYPELVLCDTGGMSFGCLYEVLKREEIPVTGTPEEFTFTNTDSEVCSFSYAYKEPLLVTDYGEKKKLSDIFYYLSNGNQVVLSQTPDITMEQFHSLTGLEFEEMNDS